MRSKMTEGEEWEQYERNTVTRQRERANRVRSKSRRAHSHNTTSKQREALAHPAALRPGNRTSHPTRTYEHKVAFLGSYTGPAKTEEQKSSERPDWMSDPSKLPKKPPGRA